MLPSQFERRDMDPKTSAILIELIVVPVIQELMTRRNTHGVNKKTLTAFKDDPQAIITTLIANKGLLGKVIQDLADGIDNVGSDLVDALAAVFGAVTPGGPDADGGNQ